EGTDNDGDGFINEDGPGGVDLNRNFQHEYPYWEADAGKYMVSEVESRAIMDFVLGHRNIAAILSFGETDNLVTPPDSRGGLAGARVLDLETFAAASNAGVFDVGASGAGGGFGGGMRGFGGFGGRGGGGAWLRGAQPGRDNDPSSGTRPVTTVATGDLVYFNAVSDAYKEITGIEYVPVHRTPEGAFFQYGYYQYGIPSFSTPGWGLPAAGGEPARARGPQADSPEEPGQARTPPTGNRGGGALPGARAGMAPQVATGRGGAAARGGSGADAQLLQRLEAAGIDAFADWTPFQHPDLGEVEIGGFLPYVTHNPPAEQLHELGAQHGEFLVKLAGMLPRVRIANTEVTALGGGLFTVEAEVENGGFFPTSLQHGVRSRSVGPTLLQIQIDPGDIMTGADKTTSLGVLSGSGARESVTWVIRGQEGDRVEIKLISAKSGQDTATITLR
ncbi:MAG: M14 family zinc carboxypeptidase, partial [Gemmatimonadota bacterium]